MTKREAERKVTIVWALGVVMGALMVMAVWMAGDVVLGLADAKFWPIPLVVVACAAGALVVGIKAADRLRDTLLLGSQN